MISFVAASPVWIMIIYIFHEGKHKRRKIWNIVIFFMVILCLALAVNLYLNLGNVHRFLSEAPMLAGTLFFIPLVFGMVSFPLPVLGWLALKARQACRTTPHLKPAALILLAYAAVFCIGGWLGLHYFLYLVIRAWASFP